MLIAPQDGMYLRRCANADEHYLRVGRDAVEVMRRAIGSASPRRVLDLPCGYGRVTRHLPAFLPDATIYAGDIEPAMVAFVAEHFGAVPFAFDRNFIVPASRSFHLIWVGSLLTHLSVEATMLALHWFCRALAPGGILVATTHGFAHERHPEMPVERWHEMLAGFVTEGIGYSPDNPAEPSIGHTLIRPSWLMRQVEDEPGIRVVRFEDAGWVGAQDVLVARRG